MVGGYPTDMGTDLLGSPRATMPIDTVPIDLCSPGILEPGKIVDLSGTARVVAAASLSSDGSGFGISGSSAASSSSFATGPSWDRGPSSIEGGSGAGLSLAGLTPANIMRQLATRPMTELVRDHGQQLLRLPRIASSTYAAAARRYLRPWTDFLQLRPGRIVEGFRRAQRRGEIQVYVQRNVLANTRQFCPNYIFVFLATLVAFVCTSPMLLCMLSLVGGGWGHALRNEEFRNRPWQLQIGGVQIPLGQNMKMLLMALPTLLCLHFFMGPVLWSAALCSGGASLGHAALRDREDDPDDDDHGLGSDRIREVA